MLVISFLFSSNRSSNVFVERSSSQVAAYFVYRQHVFRPRTPSWRRWYVKITKPNATESIPPNAQSEISIKSINSSMDEAWQLLSHLRTIKNPIAIQSDILEYIWKSYQNSIRLTSNADNILGGRKFEDIPIRTKYAIMVIYVIALVSILFTYFRYEDVGDIVRHAFLQPSVSTSRYNNNFFVLQPSGYYLSYIAEVFITSSAIISFTTKFGYQYYSALGFPLHSFLQGG